MTLRADYSGAPVGSKPSNLATLVAAADFGYAFLIAIISSDAFAFLGLSGMLWLLAYAYFLARLPFVYRAFGRFVQGNLVFLIFPALCLISTMWSDLPKETVRISVQLTVTTFIALFLGFRFSVRELLLVLSLALALLICCSVLNISGAISYPYDDRGNFVGIFLSKNALGHRMVMFVVLATFLAFFIRRIPLVLRLAYVAWSGLAVGLISISGSATAIAMTLAMSMLNVAAFTLARIRWIVSIAALLCALLLAAAIVAVSAFGASPFDTVTGLLHRSSTLTGRTILWDFGWRHYLERPFLGYGAGGFWTNPLFYSEIIPIQERYGDGVGAFHNLVVELLVMLGPLGLPAHGLAGLAFLRRSIVRASGEDRSVGLCALMLGLALYGMAMFGPQLFQQHSIPWIALVAVGSSLAKPRLAA